MASTVRLTSPLTGDVLNRHDGSSAAATREGDRFRARVLLQGRQNTITAGDGVNEHSVQVLWDCDSTPRYRFSVDDNVLFLKDIARGSYRSLFDHWYLGFWRGLNRRYGTKVHINVYYQTDESVGSPRATRVGSPRATRVGSGPQFKLPEMPDRYRSEWQDNADWLHLTFHGWQNMPDKPYTNATYEQMAHDYDAVTGEIVRFAGEATVGRFTTVHWAETTREAVKALRDRGVIGLMGGFRSEHGRLPTTRYYLDAAQTQHLGGRDYWYDSSTDMRFVCFDACVNWYNKDQILPHLDAVGSDAHRAELIELIVHEEYFRSELHWYKPDMQETCERAARWAHERGYKPAFWGDGFYGT